MNRQFDFLLLLVKLIDKGYSFLNELKGEPIPICSSFYYAKSPITSINDNLLSIKIHKYPSKVLCFMHATSIRKRCISMGILHEKLLHHLIEISQLFHWYIFCCCVIFYYIDIFLLCLSCTKYSSLVPLHDSFSFLVFGSDIYHMLQMYLNVYVFNNLYSFACSKLYYYTYLNNNFRFLSGFSCSCSLLRYIFCCIVNVSTFYSIYYCTVFTVYNLYYRM